MRILYTFLAVSFCMGCAMSDAHGLAACNAASKSEQELLDQTDRLLLDKAESLFPTSPYPLEVERGCVKLQFTLTSDGIAVDAKIVEAEPARIFDRQAIETLRKYRFKPSSQVSRDGMTIIKFDLKGSERSPEVTK